VSVLHRIALFAYAASQGVPLASITVADHAVHAHPRAWVIRAAPDQLAHKRAEPQVIGSHCLRHQVQRWRGLRHFMRHDAGEPGGSAALAQEKQSSDGVGEST